VSKGHIAVDVGPRSHESPRIDLRLGQVERHGWRE
jgi:hypothetical protein